jgi:hypothetical protein
MATQSVAKHRPAKKRAIRKASSPDFAAVITEADVDKIEGVARGFGVNRRILTASMMRSREELIDSGAGLTPEQTGGAILEMLDAAHEYDKHLDAMKDMVKTASARLIAAAQTMIDRGLVE